MRAAAIPSARHPERNPRPADPRRPESPAAGTGCPPRYANPAAG